MNKGTVKFWNHKKGYGFITPTDGGDDVFVHITALPNKRAVKEGQTLFYTVEKNEKGKLSAANVSLDGKATQAVSASGDSTKKWFIIGAVVVGLVVLAYVLSMSK